MLKTNYTRKQIHFQTQIELLKFTACLQKYTATLQVHCEREHNSTKKVESV